MSDGMTDTATEAPADTPGTREYTESLIRADIEWQTDRLKWALENQLRAAGKVHAIWAHLARREAELAELLGASP